MFWGSPIPENLIADEVKDKIEINKEKNPIHHQKTHHQKKQERKGGMLKTKGWKK